MNAEDRLQNLKTSAIACLRAKKTMIIIINYWNLIKQTYIHIYLFKVFSNYIISP